MSLLEDSRIGWTAALVLAALVFFIASTWFLHTMNEGRYAWQRRLRERLGVPEGKRIAELVWLWTSIQFLLWPAAAWGLLRIWDLQEVAETLRALLITKGFFIGKTQILPARLLAGLVWFLLLFTFTRWLRSKLETRILTRAGIEISTRESVATLFGYVTFAIAAVVGLSVAGVSFSKLAIVAGALSVGIGFGLQDIFKNFISGLILLFEQRVRVGDAITVGSASGVVRKIRIRFTEIDTADRECMIVPNSELLSNYVKNNNIQDRRGRVVMQIGVAYGSDTALVKQLLLDIANGQSQAIRDDEDTLPGPRVFFADFAASALMFELQMHIRTGDQKGVVASELRFAIDAAFREHGIEMPFAQQDLWVRQLPELRVQGAAPAPQEQGKAGGQADPEALR